ncbi:MAG: sulfite exporter TauE/SafE family protein [Terracidiphilus sp.]
MTAFDFTGAVWILSFLAGFLGALTGLGGGVVVVPALTLALGVNIKYAIGASLVSVIATSSGAAAAYVREGYSNIRIGMFLEIATTPGRNSRRISCRPRRHARSRHHLRSRSRPGCNSIVHGE